MKKISIFLMVSTITVSAVSANAAETNKNTDDHGAATFKKMDANNNGLITMDEIKTHHKKFYDDLDADKSGKVSLAEAKAAGKSLDKFRELDNKEKDGHASFEESLKVEEDRFEQADTNSNKEISWDEYVAHYEAAQAAVKK